MKPPTKPTFIHKYGCACDAETCAESYEVQLREARRAYLEAPGMSHTVEGAISVYPDGCCVGWGTTEWPPSRHVDYHLLALWAAAVAANGGGRLGAAPPGHPAEAAIDALVAALSSAPHGAQPDGSFVTQRSTRIASGRYVYTLDARGRGGPLAEVQDGESWGSGPSLRTLRTREEALVLRKEERARNRVAAQEREVQQAAVDAAVAAGAWVWYDPGQEFGTIRLEGPGPGYAGWDGWWDYSVASAPVSARGVCRRAGVNHLGLPEHSCWIRVWGAPEPAAPVRIRDLGRARRLPASARRAVAA